MLEKFSIYQISGQYFTLSTNDQGLRVAKSSFHLCQWILRYSSMERTDKYVASIIATYWNKRHNLAFPSYQQISSLSGLSSTTIGRAINGMRLSGEWLIFPERNSNSGGSRANNYIPLAPKNDDSSFPIKNHAHQKWDSYLKKEIISQFSMDENSSKFEVDYLNNYNKYVKSLDKSKFVRSLR